MERKERLGVAFRRNERVVAAQHERAYLAVAGVSWRGGLRSLRTGALREPVLGTGLA